MKQFHFLRVLALTALCPFALQGQDFLNGSFEDNNKLCLINTSTSVFNANVKNTHAFGSFRKPDIASSDCGFGEAKEGNWFIGLATNVQGGVRSEAISLKLNAPLEEGKQYSLSFWTRSRTIASNLEVGLSANDSTAGKIFYTVAASSVLQHWTEVHLRFTAAHPGQYITIRAINANENSGVWLDAFHLNTVFQPEQVIVASKTTVSRSTTIPTVTKTETEPSVGFYPNPTEGVFRVSANDNQLLSLTVYDMVGGTIEQHIATDDQPVPNEIDLTAQQPGLYLVEVATITGEKITRRIVISR
jgi:Secretion system C-terminal sorting domain